VVVSDNHTTGKEEEDDEEMQVTKPMSLDDL
jgi:hypothetical protein